MENNYKDELLELLEENIHNLVQVQEQANNAYKDLTNADYMENYNKLCVCLYDEQVLLGAIIYNLNNYFNTHSRLWFRRFRLTRGFNHRYVIRPPLGLRKDTYKYTLVKKLLISLHEEYFLCGGFSCYVYSSTEDHMWEIPDKINENELIKSLRKDKKQLKNIGEGLK